MPAYNEATTFAQCFAAVTGKQLNGVDKEVIVVESNSSDGTRELARKLCQDGGARLILQERAVGKGNAVREGLAAATGNIILIQDADLEYDVNDYDALLRPILQNKTAFVLGSRHSGSWKLREFNDQPGVAMFFNVGHVLFRASLNLLLRQSLKDPFTMYKVFRADCLSGLRFEADRFDFDFEVLIKLVRKGYQPLEVPVNYRARSLTEGKKVSAVRDPITWVRALVKYRFERLECESTVKQ
ncbi:MAG: glycosyltransferase family 2 protein [Chthoniobacterales bacterium]|nr:MAG: glycosyltransferase family 2 protein [Chthoniobacterales bacterium]